MIDLKNIIAQRLKSRKAAKPAATPGVVVDPKQVFLGGRVSKKVLWLVGLILAVVLSLTVAIIAGKGQHASDASEDESGEVKSGGNNQVGMNDILATAPDSTEITAAGSDPDTSTETGSPSEGGNTGAPATGNKEDPAVRQARLDAEREKLRVSQIREQQFEAALMSNGRIQIDLDDQQPTSTAAGGKTTQDKVQPLNVSQSQPDPNHQDDKLAFSQAEHSNTYLPKGREAPVSTTELKVGTVIPATLISGINSDLPGQVIAQVNQDVYDSATHSQILLPQGSKLYGVYDSHVSYGQDRLLMAWTRVNFPDGTTLELNGMGGADAAGYAGFADQVDHHYFKIFGNAFLLGVISGALESSVSDGDDSDTSTNESVKDGVVQQFATAGSSLIQKNLDVQPTIKIRNGYKFNVMLNKDVILPPYQPVN